jgi:hypothetical protein
VVDRAVGMAGPPPMTVAQARAKVIQAQDHLDECRETRAALKSELERNNQDFVQGRVRDAAIAVVRAEVGARGAVMAAAISKLQRQVVEHGSALQWLAVRGVFPNENGKPADAAIRHAVGRMEQTPSQWIMTTTPREQPFAEQVGAQRWAAAFETLLRDASAALPDLA